MMVLLIDCQKKLTGHGLICIGSFSNSLNVGRGFGVALKCWDKASTD